MNKPVTKEDIARITAFQQYLVPISKFKQQRNVTKELNPEVVLEAERMALVDDGETADVMIRNCLKDLVKANKKSFK